MISAHGLTMHYGPVVALDRASFEVKKGEVVGLLGPNGAGKSTTMKILTTYLYPTAGMATVSGYNILKEPIEVRRRIGYLPEILPLYMDMEVRDFLTFVGRARGLGPAELADRKAWVVEKCGLKPMYRKLMKELSKGFRQRTGLAQALIHDPEVVILDEATSGLDPHQILEIRYLIRELAQEKTVIFSTHVLQEAQAVCDRIFIISNGKIIAHGTIQELMEQAMASERARIEVAHSREEVEKALIDLNVKEIFFEGEHQGAVCFTVKASVGFDLLKKLGQIAAQNQWTLYSLYENPFSLEETFLALTEPEKQSSTTGEIK